MRVVVVGLLAKQSSVFEAEAHRWPHLSIHFASKNKLHTGRDKQLAHADRILVVVKFESRLVDSTLDRSKIVNLQGGMTNLRHALDSLNSSAKVVGDAPAPKTSQIKEFDLTRTDYSSIKNGKPGEVVVFTRPDGVAAHKFKQSIANTRTFHKREYGIETEVEWRGAKAYITITKVRDEEMPMVEPLRGTDPLPTMPMLPAGSLQLPAPTMDFWKAAFLQVMATEDLSMEQYAAKADEAVAQLRLRYPEVA